MKFVRSAMLVVGIVAALIGLVWVGQGSGYFPYPKSSFMIDQSVWITRGAMLAVVGVLAAIASRRI